MTAKSDLFQAYEQWRRWTESEGDAIRVADWAQVGRCQSAKEQLQSLIIHLSEIARSEWNRQGGDWTEVEGEVNAVVRELIALEVRNSQWLAAQREADLAGMARLKKAGRSLRQVRKSYGQARSGVWESYS